MPAVQPFTRERAAFLLPETNPFLAEMFAHIAGPSLDKRLTWAVDHLAELLNRADIAGILTNFGKRTRREDPVVHFYETFLAAYDPKMRKVRGVYYTPEPVVSYIVRSIDHILKKDFGLKDGLADTTMIPLYKTVHDRNGNTRRKKVGECHKVLILDPACGTGTFLHGVIDHIHEHIVNKGQAGTWSSYVSKHLLPRVFGFELLMAPYAVAHMKLGLQLAETGYDFQSGERLRIYLTNTLEEAHEFAGLDLFATKIAQEANAASGVKSESPVMVILGNPPYSGLSENRNSWIEHLLKNKLPGNRGAQGYYTADGQPLGEKKVWLQDDYVKFMRLAQYRIELTGYGILSFITNHGYLDNPTFRGMRQSLTQTFDSIYILDLHGSSKKKQVAPQGLEDKNVFDIQQGVAIGLFVKRPTRSHAPAKVYHADLWGNRRQKYQWLLGRTVAETAHGAILPNSPYYFFVPRDETLRGEYESFWGLTSLAGRHLSGVVTARDAFAVAFDEAVLVQRMREFSDLSIPDVQVRSKYKLTENYAWRVSPARESLSKDLSDSAMGRQYVESLLYRPFDVRSIFYHPAVVWRPRLPFMLHMTAGPNLGLATTRSVEIGRGWEHALCTTHIIQHHTVSLKEVNYLFPLYLYSHLEDVDLFRTESLGVGDSPRRPNLSREFIEEFSGKLGLSFIPEGKGDLGQSGARDGGGQGRQCGQDAHTWSLDILSHMTLYC